MFFCLGILFFPFVEKLIKCLNPPKNEVIRWSYFGDFKDHEHTFIGSRSLMASPYNFLISSSLAFCLSLMSWCNGYIIYVNIMTGKITYCSIRSSIRRVGDGVNRIGCLILARNKFHFVKD